MSPFVDGLVRFRVPVIVALHVVVFTLAYLLAFAVRFDFYVPALFTELMWTGLPIFLASKLLAFAIFRQFTGWWRYVSLNDVITIAKAAALSVLFAGFGALLAGFFVSRPSFPRAIFLLDAILTVGALAGVRVMIRLLRERILNDPTGLPGETTRTLIVGTGPSAESLARSVGRKRDFGTHIVGFIAEDARLKGSDISGIPILGGIDRFLEVVEARDVEQVIVAVEGMSADDIRRVVSMCTGADIRHRVLPTTDALLHGQVSMSALRDVDLRDLLGRPPVRLSSDVIARNLNNKVVLVTGAGGSIGSELCRQVARFGPMEIVLVEQAENPLFHLERELMMNFPNVTLQPIIADIYDSERLSHILATTRPSVVLHAAAHKHVPLMEANPSEAVKNNIIGTLNVIRAAQRAEVETCVLISTDKAVNPTSVMGASKRVAELLMQALAVNSKTRLAAVRFGNVLGSNGSVIPIFKQQIAEGGPVTVTHPEMRRFFMTIPEASQLVLQAATYANAGDIFVLDMGEPVYIVDVARDLIRLSGLEPDRDVEIVFSGMRPGEKLFEELSTDHEEMSQTDHERIFRCEDTPVDPRPVLDAALELEKAARAGTPPGEIRTALFQLLRRLDPSAK